MRKSAEYLPEPRMKNVAEASVSVSVRGVKMPAAMDWPAIIANVAMDAAMAKRVNRPSASMAPIAICDMA